MAPLGAERVRARDEALFGRIVGAAFEQRRKMLRGALRGIVTPQVFEAAGVDSTRRGETLSVAQFVALADAAVAA
jgi:16S rRNA (adenine1518-N6/adenine1519-N6)-dimethyltransferase